MGANPTRSRHCKRIAGFSKTARHSSLSDDGEGEKPAKTREPGNLPHRVFQSALREKETWNVPEKPRHLHFATKKQKLLFYPPFDTAILRVCFNLWPVFRLRRLCKFQLS